MSLGKAPSFGIVLSGGGTRSSYAVGALRALAEVHHTRVADIEEELFGKSRV